MQITVSSKRRQELIDITSKVQKCIDQSGVKEGLCNVYAQHATGAIIINENDDLNIEMDLLSALNKAIPEHASYLHDSVDNNAQSHILSAILGPSEIIPIRGGKLALGTWQAIMFVELDGPRSNRKIEITTL